MVTIIFDLGVYNSKGNHRQLYYMEIAFRRNTFPDLGVLIPFLCFSKQFTRHCLIQFRFYDDAKASRSMVCICCLESIKYFRSKERKTNSINVVTVCLSEFDMLLKE
jgi:hypothetical protein